MLKGLILGLLLYTAIMPRSLRAETVDIYTTNIPPLTMLTPAAEINTPPALGHGFAGDIAFQAITRAGLTMNIVDLPWRRAQEVVAHGRDLLIIPLSRIPSREPHYTWIAPLAPLHRVFATLQAPSANSYAEARSRFRSIGVGLGSAQYTSLVNEGFSLDQLVTVPLGPRGAELLAKGRVESWFNSEAETLWLWRTTGQQQPLVLGQSVETNMLYLACSLQCDPGLVSRLALQVEAIRATGEAEQIIAAYR